MNAFNNDEQMNAQEHGEDPWPDSPFYHRAGSSSQGSKARKGNKRHADMKGRIKASQFEDNTIVYVENLKEPIIKIPRSNKGVHQVNTR